MFDSILGKVVKPEEVYWNEPKYINFVIDGEQKTSEIYKGADIFLHKKLDIKPGTSKEVYKKSQDIWKNLRDCQLSKLKDNPDSRDYFALDKDSLVYILDNRDDLIDVFDAYNLEGVQKFKDSLEKFIIDITTIEKTKKFFADGKGDIIKLICYDSSADLPNEEYTPIVLFEMSNKKSEYKVYTGILIFKTFTFIPSMGEYLNCDCYSDLIKMIDLSVALDYSKSKALDLYDAYKSFQQNPVEVSARELISLLKKVGYKLELLEDNSLNSISAIDDEESNKKIQNFFNTFKFTTGESAYDILALTELKKIFRYNKLTLLDTLSILSKEYLSYEGGKITADILSGIVYNLYDKQNDKRQSESIKNEIID